MNTRDFFKDIYSDFFGVEKLERENEKLRKELGLDKIEIPEIVVKKNNENGTSSISKEIKTSAEEPNIDDAHRREIDKEERDESMAEWFATIDELFITEESKELLKKIIEYMRKYDEKVEKNYIPFNMQIIAQNKETVETITKIMHLSSYLFSYVQPGNGVSLSMYDVTKTEDITVAYKARDAVILLKDLKAFELQEDKFKDVALHTLEANMISHFDKIITIVAGKDAEEIQTFFVKNPSMLEKYFAYKILEVQPDIQDVYQAVLKKIGGTIEISEEMEVSLLDYISNTYPKTELDFPSYRDNLCSKISFTKEVPKYDQEKTLDEIFAELNELVGLQKVKKVLYELVDLIELKKKTKGELKIKDVNLHMVFLGNPGTGKTTVARIIAEILYQLKYIKQNKLIEASSKDLVAEYVGQTAPKTMSVIEKAMGGVLFIDEAYSLASGGPGGNSFNEEAIATLIQGMENHRDNLVVIFAGYTKEMQDFLNANSGIVSRIGYTLEFDDYTADELIAIFKGMMKKSGFTVTEDAIEEVRKVINEYKGTKNFGNARFVRSVYEKSIIKHASNTKNKKKKTILKTITKEDISTDDLLKM